MADMLWRRVILNSAKAAYLVDVPLVELWRRVILNSAKADAC